MRKVLIVLLVAILAGIAGGILSTVVGAEPSLTVRVVDDLSRESIEDAMVSNSAVVFNVAGRVDLGQSPLVLDGVTHLYVFGNTAPGCVQFHGAPVILNNVRNVHIQEITIRAGYETPAPKSWDALQINYQSRNVIIDRCSLAGGHDEVLQVWAPPETPAPDSITIRRCLIGPGYRGLRGHNHSALINATNFEFTDNICAHNARRSPQVDPRGTLAIIERNIIYNYGTMAIGIKSGAFELNGNVAVPGRQSRVSRPKNWPKYLPWYKGYPLTQVVRGTSGEAIVNFGGNCRVDGYRIPKNMPYVPNSRSFANPMRDKFNVDIVYTGEPVRPVELNVENSGNPADDGWDSRFREDVLNQTGSWVNHPDDIGGIPNVPTVRHDFDWSEVLKDASWLTLVQNLSSFNRDADE